MTEYRTGEGDHWAVEDGEIELQAVVTSVDVRIPNGSVTVAVADGPPRVFVADAVGGPVTVLHAGGAVVVRQPGPEGVEALEEMVGSWLGAIGIGSRRGRRASVTVLLPAPAPVVARTVAAEVMFSGIEDASVDTVSGEVIAAGVRGRLSARSVSGEVTVVRSDLDELRAQTISGDLAVDAVLHAGDHVFRSVSGDLALRAAFPEGLTLDASTVSGRVVCGAGEAVETGRPGGRRVTSSVGEGGARLTSHTVSGDLTVVPRPATVGAE